MAFPIFLHLPGEYGESRPAQHTAGVGGLSKLPEGRTPGLSVHPGEPRRLVEFSCSQSVLGWAMVASSWGAVGGWELGGLHLFQSSLDSPEPRKEPASSLSPSSFPGLLRRLCLGVWTLLRTFSFAFRASQARMISSQSLP